jgi:uncharacterized protein YraI
MSRRQTALLIAAIIFGALFSVIVSTSNISNAQDFGANPWTSQFYNSTSVGTGPVPGATPTYTAGVNFNWGVGQPTDGSGVPLAGVPADNFSAVFTSTQTFQAATYRFTALADDQVRVFINGQQVINGTAPNVSQTADVVMPGGVALVRVEFVEFTGPAFVQVQWTLTGAGGGVVTPGGPTVTPAPTVVPTRTPLPSIPAGSITATVIRASVLNIRDSPSLGGGRIGRILRGDTYRVIGRDDGARWFLLQLGGYQGWAFGYYLYIPQNEFSPPIVSGNSILGLAGQPDTGVRIQTHATLRLREAPTVASRQIGRVTWGAFVPVIGRNAHGDWLQVVWKNTVGWVYAPFTDLRAGNMANVPVR